MNFEAHFHGRLFPLLATPPTSVEDSFSSLSTMNAIIFRFLASWHNSFSSISNALTGSVCDRDQVSPSQQPLGTIPFPLLTSWYNSFSSLSNALTGSVCNRDQAFSLLAAFEIRNLTKLSHKIMRRSLEISNFECSSQSECLEKSRVKIRNLTKASR